MSFRRSLALVVLAGLAVRVASTVLLGGRANGPLAVGDVQYYHEVANLLASGHGYINPRAFHDGLVLPSAEHPPLWPLLLAAVSWLGGTGMPAHRLVGCVVGAGVIACAGLLGRRIGGPRAGLAAACVAAAYPILIAADGSLMSESLYGLWLALALLAALRLRERPTPARAAVLGAAVALAALTRAEALLLVPLVGLPLALTGGRGRTARAAALALACAAVLAPWTVRNLRTFERHVLISTNAGTVAAGANCDATYHGELLGFWTPQCFTPPRYDDESLQSDVWRRQGLRYAREHAGRLPIVLAARLGRTWDVYRPGQEVLYAEGRNMWVERAGLAVYFLLLPLAAFGALALRRRRGELLVLLSPVVLVTATTLTALGQPRFRHAAEIPLVALAGAGLARVRAPSLAARRLGRAVQAAARTGTAAGSDARSSRAASSPRRTA